ncbi:MAG: DNA repair protein RadC [Elusimicrobia bacterium]|nr:DNA repair protein RadC [Elusimicrobiota bacterium]
METNEIKNLNLGHRNRVKEKFLKTNFEGWQDYEILEFALFFVIPYKDTKPAAKKLIQKFGILKEILNADYSELETSLKEIKGAGKHTLLFLYFLKHFAIKYSELKIKEKDYFSCQEDVCKFLKNLIGSSSKEKMCAVFLNSAGDILGHKIMSEGTVGKSAIYPNEIAKEALLLNSRSVIISHNHPGGNCKPSKNDEVSTELVKGALSLVDIVLLDHIIVSDLEYYSFKEKGLL